MAKTPHCHTETLHPKAGPHEFHPSRQSRQSCRAIALLITLLFVPLAWAQAATITGTDDSDNNSFSFFPVWRSQLTGTAGDDALHGLRGDDLLYGRGGDDVLDGDQDSDRLYGESGNDRLVGGLEFTDWLYGGTGNDSYLIWDRFDLAIESAGQGDDLVRTTVDYTLPNNVEDAYLEPNLNSYGLIVQGPNSAVTFHDCDTYTGGNPCREMGTRLTGNNLANILAGNGLDNVLDGRAGNDHLLAGRGNDQVFGGTGNDVLEGFHANRSWASVEFDELTGGSGADVFVIGLSDRPAGRSYYHPDPSENFPQYLGQGMVYIMDFDWREGDKIEVYGEISDYSVGFWGTTALIYWDGSAEGFGSNELVGVAYGINSASDLIPAHDFI